MRIALDLDSTISHFLEATLEKYNKLYNDDLRPEDITDWNMENFLKCSKEEMYALWTPDFIRNVKPRKYAKEVISILQEMGCEVVVATAYHRSMCEAKVEWLEDHLGLSETDTIFIRKKYLLDVHMLVDDGLHNFVDGESNPTDFEKVVFGQPYNKNPKNIGLHYRIECLSELPKLVTGLIK